MKNKLFIGAMILVFSAHSMNVLAQLKVAADGKVAIGCSDSLVVPLSALTISTPGSTQRGLSIEKSNPSDNQYNEWYNIYSKVNAQNDITWHYALTGYTVGIPLADRVIGVRGAATKTSASSSGRSYGVMGMAGSATPGWNYGVIGFLASDNDQGAGIYGGLTSGTESNVGGRYAGYFKGQTKVNGDFYATTLNTTSDIRLKTNISDMKHDALSEIKQLRPIQFQWQQLELSDGMDTAKVPAGYLSTDIDFERLHYGFVAQEVYELLPNLVQEDGVGYLSLNYIELIPLLVKAIQELSAEVNELRGAATQQTTAHGEGSAIIEGNQLEAGSYVYTLVADDQIVDTKQMRLTK